MNVAEYNLMLQRQDYQSLVGILAAIDSERYPERVEAVRLELERRKARGEPMETPPPADAVPKWKIQKNWHRINATLVGILSAVSCYSIVTATDDGFYINPVAVFFGVLGLAGVILYFRKFRIGHYLLLLWWMPQAVELETDTFRYSLYTGLKFGLEFRFGQLEIGTNAIAILSCLWLIVFKKHYEKSVQEAPR